MKRVIGAHTTYSNNELTDKEEKVLYDVQVNVNGFQLIVRIHAIDPLDAIDIVNKMDEVECMLFRVEEIRSI